MLSETHFLRLSKKHLIHFKNSITSSVGKNRQLDGTKMKHKRFASAAPNLPCVRTRHSLILCKLKLTAVISKRGMNIYWCKLLQKSIMLQPTIALGFISFWFESSLRHFGEGQWGLIRSYYIRVWWRVCLILWCISLTHTRSCVEIQFNMVFFVCVCVCLMERSQLESLFFSTPVSVVDTLFVFAEAKHHCQITQAMWTVFLVITTLIRKQKRLSEWLCYLIVRLLMMHHQFC